MHVHCATNYTCCCMFYFSNLSKPNQSIFVRGLILSMTITLLSFVSSTYFTFLSCQGKLCFHPASFCFLHAIAFGFSREQATLIIYMRSRYQGLYSVSKKSSSISSQSSSSSKSSSSSSSSNSPKNSYSPMLSRSYPLETLSIKYMTSVAAATST